MKKDYWNNLFNKRKCLLPPEIFLKENYLLLRGKVLDLASGDGRNSIFLAEKGFEVIAVDFSEIALRKIEGFNNPKISTVLVDLATEDNFKAIKDYDSVLVNHFLPSDEVLLIMQERLKSKSTLMMVAFSNEEEKYHFSFDRIETLLNNMKVVKKETFSNDWGDFNGIILEKK